MTEKMEKRRYSIIRNVIFDIISTYIVILGSVCFFKAKPIQELRKKLVPEMMELIKQNRLNYLIAGTRFNRYVQKGIAMTVSFLNYFTKTTASLLLQNK